MPLFKNNKIIISLLLIFLVALFYYLKSLKVDNREKELPVTNISVEDCVIQKQVCTIETDKFKLNISSDEKIEYLRPFNILISTETKNYSEIDKIQLDFKMIGMNMGVNRFVLKTSDTKKNTHVRKGKQIWKGKALLPVCVSGRADWVAEVEVLASQVRYILTFPISVQSAKN